MPVQTFVSIFLILSTPVTYGNGLSAYRAPTQTYQMIRGDFATQATTGRSSPEQFKVVLALLDTSSVPEISDTSLFISSFNYLRDTRFIQDTDSDFKRRLTWLYPDDGCYARAELESIFAQERSLPAPSKIFAFGNLTASTKNSPSGYVNWWYHVSIAYKHNGIVYVLDPAIEPKFPLTIEQWGQRMGLGNTKIEFSLCSSKTLDPTHDCINPKGVTAEEALKEQYSFLNLEWKRVENLGRSPISELGDNPPWYDVRNTSHH